MGIESREMNESGTRCTRMRLGTMELRNTGVSELSLIASVNEAIKCAIAASGNVSLIAVNANLVARRAGSNAAGFCVVAHELRMFSERMVKTMQSWSELIYELVRETAHSRNQSRCMDKLRAAADCSPKVQAVITAVCERSRNALDAITKRNSALVFELQSLISRAEKQRVTGEVIARSALIESAYGGPMQPVLQQIAKDIDASIANFASFSRNVGNLMQKVAI